MCSTTIADDSQRTHVFRDDALYLDHGGIFQQNFEYKQRTKSLMFSLNFCSLPTTPSSRRFQLCCGRMGLWIFGCTCIYFVFPTRWYDYDHQATHKRIFKSNDAHRTPHGIVNFEQIEKTLMNYTSTAYVVAIQGIGT